MLAELWGRLPACPLLPASFSPSAQDDFFNISPILKYFKGFFLQQDLANAKHKVWGGKDAVGLQRIGA